MVKKVMSMLFVMMLLTGLSYATDKTVVFTWDKDVIEEDLAGFEIAEFDDKDIATGLIIDIPFVQGQTDFSKVAAIDYPTGQKTKRIYRILAYDFSKNKSAWSEPTNITVDFEAPGGCLNFKVLIR